MGPARLRDDATGGGCPQNTTAAGRFVREGLVPSKTSWKRPCNLRDSAMNEDHGHGMRRASRFHESMMLHNAGCERELHRLRTLRTLSVTLLSKTPMISGRRFENQASGVAARCPLARTSGSVSTYAPA